MLPEKGVLNEANAAAGFKPSQSTHSLVTKIQARTTFLLFNDTLMGPTCNVCDVEQGGTSSWDQFQIMTNKELKTANDSYLGIQVSGIYIS